MPADHRHQLQRCNDCDGEGCSYCDGYGYLRPEFCEVCGEPMGNLRRVWKREGRPKWDDGERVRRWYTRRASKR